MKRLIAIVLSFFILGTNLGFSIGVHYCGGRIAESKLLITDHVLGCGMESDKKSCNASDASKVSKVPCCKDEIASIQLEEKTDLKTQKVIVSQVITLEVKSIAKSLNTKPNTSYFIDLSIPDKPKPSFQVLFQSFLL